MHEVKEEHKARWGGRRRAGAAETANSGEALVRRCWRRARALLLLLFEREANEMEEREADVARRV